MALTDEEKRLAALALRNAFWEDFSALVNGYLVASGGLDVDEQEMLIGELTSVYGRDGGVEPDCAKHNIWVQTVIPYPWGTVGHTTLVAALEHPGAIEVHLHGKKIFERRNGEWHFCSEA